ncbi:hypothetical protein D3OALGA1CA_5789 [Olavius algarvensis associated proteobacterium Delta 3]|nr:hypothetical protein D3OALGB2SA_1214 [Olavius algarvensis associated proteobacterium Delta 3]CAB5171881.1 hypothetical protein D3OALGA1CA_5789 [Olavius algarvensis associated proteobacterium Delta 3]
MNLVERAEFSSPERRVQIGILALEVNEYHGTEIISAVPPETTRDISGSPVQGLHVWSQESSEIPIFHDSTSTYGFLKLPVGKQRIFIQDPKNYYQPYALEIDVKPERYHVKEMLERGITPPPGSEGLIKRRVLLRHNFRFPLSSGKAAVWGQVRKDQGRPLPFSWLEFETRLNGNVGKIRTYTGIDGMYLAFFPQERGIIIGGTNQRHVEIIRAVEIFQLIAPWADEIAEQDALSILPPSIDQLTILEFQSFWTPANNFHFLKDGEPDQATSNLSVHVERSVRWDIIVQ